MKQMDKINLKLVDGERAKVAFVCNHNSCRSQMAEAIGKLCASDVFDSYSAGTIIKNQINPDAVRLIKSRYGVDMELTQFNKKLADIPQPDIIIFMGCNVSCPMASAKHTENWGLDDPSGQSDEFFNSTIDTIEEKVLELKAKLS